MTYEKLTITGILAALLAACAAGLPSAAAQELRQPPTFERDASTSYEQLVPVAAVREVPDEQPVAELPSPQPGPAKEEAQASAEEKPEEKADEAQPFRLFDSPLRAHRIEINGWLDQGYTWNPQNPLDRFNGPVGYNDRANEYQLNQFYMFAERVTKTDGCGIDVGGRVDLLYGTDRRWVTAFGLDSQWNDDSRFYGLAMPQAYGDLAINDLVIRAGHFLAPCGYESVMAPANFFYSHSYSFIYGQPTTLSGGELIYKVSDNYSVNVGLDTGWNDWDSTSGRVNYFGGLTWASCDQRTTLALEIFVGNTSPAEDIESTRTHYCLVLTQKIGEKWRYVLEHNLGYDSNNPFRPGTHGDWWAFTNYLFYDLNERWSFGGRLEYFSDDDGTVVERVGPPTAGPIPARYNALSLGLNWHPRQNIVLRSELRDDWATTSVHNGQRPFDDGTKNDQFLWATDLIVKF